MDFKAKLASIRSKLGEDIDKSVKSLLDEIEQGADSLSSELITVKAEAKEKRLKIESLEKDIETKGGDKEKEIEKLNNTIAKQKTEISSLKEKVNSSNIPEDYDSVKTENESLKKQVEKYNAQWTAITKERKEFLQTDFEHLLQHPKWENAVKLFKLPEKDKDEKILWDKWQDEDVEATYSEYNKLRKIDYFSDGQSKHIQRADSSVRNNNGEPDFANFTKPEHIGNFLAERLKE